MIYYEKQVHRNVKVGWPSGLGRHAVNQMGADLNPAWEFCSFFNFITFCQTLRANSQFQRILANMGPFPSKTRGPRLPLQTVRTHGVSRHLWEN